MKNLNHIIFVIFFSIGIVHAGCGSCNVSKKKAEKPVGDFVTKINEDGTIKGLVLASCGMCNFGMENRDCSLAIRVGEETFNVKGTGMEDHGDSHADDGFCNAVRIANVKGKISKGKFKSESFALIGSK